MNPIVLGLIMCETHVAWMKPSVLGLATCQTHVALGSTHG